MWRWLEQYFTFTQGEKKGIIALLTLSVVFLIIPRVYIYFKPVEILDTVPYDKEVIAFINELEERKKLAVEDDADETFRPYPDINVSQQFRSRKQVELFDFDPNTIGLAEWIRLGFSERQAASIEKAKAKGWKFYKPEDLKKMYVVSDDNYHRLAPYIKIEPWRFPESKEQKVMASKPIEKYEVDINTADSSIFEHQRGLGPVLASRIVKYRSRLGGFVTPEQIREVWGMPDSTYQSLKDRLVVKNAVITKININSADFETLRKHPYINYNYAKVIKAYREQHGTFKTFAELRKIPIMNDSILARLEPYIAIE